jgi:RND family efflux transporter MFP subunit
MPSYPLFFRLRRHVLAPGGLALALSFVAACSGTTSRDTSDAREPVAVRVVAVSSGTQASHVNAGGTVQATTSALITSRIMAPVREVRVAPGDRVRAGQVLVVLDDRDLGAIARGAASGVTAAERATEAASADVESADAALTLTKTSHARIAGLHERRSATQHELDEATAALRAAEARATSARARVGQAQASLEGAHASRDATGTTAGFASITAPFAGMVSEKLVEVGNMATPGTPLLRLEDTRGYRLDVRVDAARATALSPGDVVDVVVDANPPRRLAGRVTEVARALESDARAVLVKIALPADDTLRTGLFGRAALPGPQSDGIAVPTSAVVRRGQVTSVYVVDGEVARLRMVVLGQRDARDAEWVQVTTGLSDGERIVVSPPAGLTDGAPVRVEGR